MTEKPSTGIPAASQWQPISTAPKDGTVVDLWIVGADDTVDFYAPTAKKVPCYPQRSGRATNFHWARYAPNAPNWYPFPPIMGYGLSPNVQATHWMPLPEPPK